MATLTGKGAPTNQTEGAIGDIYTDTDSWKQYRCVFAYRVGSEGKFDCQWSALAVSDDRKPVAASELRIDGKKLNPNTRKAN